MESKMGALFWLYLFSLSYSYEIDEKVVYRLALINQIARLVNKSQIKADKVWTRY